LSGFFRHALFLRLNERYDCFPNRVRQIVASSKDTLQISVERSQVETIRAIRVQRPCGAEALAKVAITIAIVVCVEIANGFKSCRPANHKVKSHKFAPLLARVGWLDRRCE
jgi:hypothetical protein